MTEFNDTLLSPPLSNMAQYGGAAVFLKEGNLLKSRGGLGNEGLWH